MSTIPLPTPPANSETPELRVLRPDAVHLVVLVPALNEEKTVGDVVARIPREIPGIDRVEVVVVSDGSTDRTEEIAREKGAKVVRHPRPCGVGAAFQSGLRKAFELGADIVLNIDGDGQFRPEDIPKLVAPIVSGAADFVTASRFLDPALEPEMPKLKRWGNRQMSRLVSFLTRSTYHDVSCGMRAYSRDAALSLSVVEPFTYTHEVFLHLSAKRMKILEVPIQVRGQREFGKSRVARSLVRYGFNTLKIIARFYRDYHPLRFFGWMSAACWVLATPLLVICLTNYFATGSFSPHRWAGFAATVLGICGVAFLFMGVLGDMLHRQRVYLEEILYNSRSLVSADGRRNP
ncbi:MAG: glycosyltransferase family 2 protein [Planctomycetales bacterium]|nr:glycosyltransferase family 2 protein [Planctomycetales bacterium]